jgi:hypothetical protein
VGPVQCREGVSKAIDNDMPHELDVWQDTLCMAATKTDDALRFIYIHIILPSASEVAR